MTLEARSESAKSLAMVKIKTGRLLRDPYGCIARRARMLDDILHYSWQARLVRRREPKALLTLAFAPERPHVHCAIWKFSRLLPIVFCDDPAKADVVVWWSKKTQNAAAPAAWSALNGRCTNISKRRVQAAFREAFGYAMEVDPRTYQGPCVRKANGNSEYSAKIVQCPLRRVDEAFVYQIVVDNQVAHTKLVVDYRLVVMSRTIPLAYRVYRPLEMRFGDRGDSSAEITAVDQLIKSAESEAIFRFTAAIGLDYGELDVLRDGNTKRLYVVDANKTPYGPPGKLSRSERHIAIRRMADAFRTVLLDKLSMQPNRRMPAVKADSR